jgi:hypothetical protein
MEDSAGNVNKNYPCNSHQPDKHQGIMGWCSLVVIMTRQ